MKTGCRTSASPRQTFIGFHSRHESYSMICISRRLCLTIGLIILLSGIAFGLHRTSVGRNRELNDLPPLPREFRAAWVATVANIDWPSKQGLTSAQQKSEMVAIMDKAAALNLNAIVLQVRPACDAMYKSSLEPWSEYLTGAMGRAPEPFYDPLELAVHEAHKRGIELHAWFNPYRAHHTTGKSAISSNHISKTHPSLVKSYGRYLWLDPGEEAVQNHSIRVVMDVLNRYDIDGVHFDDYFYPYKEKDGTGQYVDFPDEPSWRKYVKGGGVRNREDWRRENVNSFIQRLYKAIKSKKKWVKFGISPFGIWRPGNPPQIKGYDQYDMLYADARKWLNYGWVDYWTPQLYWRIDPPEQSYPALLKWWVDENTMHRNIWPGNYTSRVGEGGANSWPAIEILNQIKRTRAQPGATGNVHFSMKTLMLNRGGIAEALKSTVYASPALVPASPWLAGAKLHEPSIAVTSHTGLVNVKWKAARGDHPERWAVCIKWGGWGTQVFPAGITEIKELDAQPHPGPTEIAVYAIDRCGVAGRPAIVKVK